MNKKVSIILILAVVMLLVSPLMPLNDAAKAWTGGILTVEAAPREGGNISATISHIGLLKNRCIID